MSIDTISATMSAVEIIDPSERIKRWGLECVGPSGDGITFKGTYEPPDTDNNIEDNNYNNDDNSEDIHRRMKW